VEEEKSTETLKESVPNDKDNEVKSNEENPQEGIKQKNQTNEDTKFVVSYRHITLTTDYETFSLMFLHLTSFFLHIWNGNVVIRLKRKKRN
jgi:hypothetical protein